MAAATDQSTIVALESLEYISNPEEHLYISHHHDVVASVRPRDGPATHPTQQHTTTKDWWSQSSSANAAGSSPRGWGRFHAPILLRESIGRGAQRTPGESGRRHPRLRRNTNGNSPSRIGGKGGNGGGSGRAIAARAGAAAALDEDEIVDNLRAEIASTRSLIQQTKVAMASKTKR